MRETQPLIEQDPSPQEALAELHEILRQAAVDATPQRMSAARYTICRDILLRSEYRPALPGFLVQCLTISRFHDFIHLLDPDVRFRLRFLDEAFEMILPRVRSRPSFDVFGDPDF